MGFVTEALFLVGLACGAAWLLSLRKSVAKDVAAARERQKQAEEACALAERDAKLLRPGEALRCLGCEATFDGPLPSGGCPQCHLAALVVTEEDYRKGKRAAAAVAADVVLTAGNGTAAAGRKEDS